MTTNLCSSAVESAKPVTLPDNWQPGPGLFDIDPKCVNSLCDLTLPFDGQPSDQWNPTSMTAAQLATWAKELERALGRYSTRLSVEQEVGIQQRRCLEKDIDVCDWALQRIEGNLTNESSQTTNSRLLMSIISLHRRRAQPGLDGTKLSMANDTLKDMRASQLGRRGDRIKWEDKESRLESQLPLAEALEKESQKFARRLKSRYTQEGQLSHLGTPTPPAYQRLSGHYLSQASKPAPADALEEARLLAKAVNEMLWEKPS